MKVSAYIPSYNQKRFLAEAIDSVLAQTRRPDQVIVVDDGSTDGSQEMIRGYASRHPDLFTTVFHERNLGVAQTRVDALSAVRCELVTYVDGDDRMCPGKVESELRCLQDHPQAPIVFSNYCYITEDASRIIRVWIDEGNRPPEGDVFEQTVTRRFPEGNLFHNELLPIACLRKVGFHDTQLSTYEDYDLRIRLTREYRTAYCPRVNIQVREHGGPRLSKSQAMVHYESIRVVLNKNRALWADLPEDRRHRIEEALRKMLADLAIQGSVQYLRTGQRGLARHAARKALSHGVGFRGLGCFVLVSMLPDWSFDSLVPFGARMGRSGRRALGYLLSRSSNADREVLDG